MLLPGFIASRDKRGATHQWRAICTAGSQTEGSCFRRLTARQCLTFRLCMLSGLGKSEGQWVHYCWGFITQITACQLQIMFGSETKDSQSSQSSCREQEAWTNAENSEQTGCRAHISENKQTKNLCRCWAKRFDPFVTKQNKQYIDTNTCITEVVVICVSIYMIGTLLTSHSMTLYGGSGVWAEQLQTFSVFNSDQFNEKLQTDQLHLRLIYILKPQSK